ncbi:RICIN domain-containing protein [Kitasatospora purpeofusca]|uniref:hypothetical protein n=1 Tax=Kitasatospora purpeofusca TaxID=67352 RepID=UPI00324AA878
MFIRIAKVASALALTIGIGGVGAVAPATAAPAHPSLAGSYFMLVNVATGNCLTAYSYGAAFSSLWALGCDRNNPKQWWGNYVDSLVEASQTNVCLVHRSLPGNPMGQAGTEICASNDNPHWTWGSNPSTISSTTGGFLNSDSINYIGVGMGPLAGNFSKWTRVY